MDIKKNTTGVFYGLFSFVVNYIKGFLYSECNKKELQERTKTEMDIDRRLNESLEKTTSKLSIIVKPDTWKCITGNIHPTSQEFCRCLSKNPNFQ